MYRLFSALTLFAVVAGAFAQPNTIGPFTGAQSDGYETQQRGTFVPQFIVFGGAATVDSLTGGQGLHITSGWSFFNVIFPHGGQVFMGGAGVNQVYNFIVPARRFGGYFGTNADVPGATATFFDTNGNQIGAPQAVNAPQASWAWNGWEHAAGISRVEIRSTNPWGGFIMNDDMEYDPAAAASVAGRVFLEDWMGPYLGRAVTVQIYAAGGVVPLETHNTTLDNVGQYSVNTSLGAGTYDVYAKASHWLRRQRGGVVFSGSGAVGVDFSLANGDINDDNENDIGDYAQLSTAFGSVPGDPNWNAEADLNGDDEVDIGDFAILSNNFGMVGD
ncbi:MAG TPA: hypothetical protein PLL78_11730 [Fimbriimonadaceae bacterium]|nr:hypothetical protein [Fimbriimonadaceae bacterium]HRJ97344.1 hypothetical protein [Fimbriimonadaceae bacterium]